MGLEEHRAAAPNALSWAVVTVSDTRDAVTDRGGAFLVAKLEGAGQRVVSRDRVRDEPDEIRAAARRAVEGGEADVVLFTGGTGIAPRDVTVPTLTELFDAEIPGFGELFRALSYQEIGSAAILSRATAGLVGRVVVFALPGSPKALGLAMDAIVLREAGHLVSQARGS